MNQKGTVLFRFTANHRGAVNQKGTVPFPFVNRKGTVPLRFSDPRRSQGRP